MVVVTEKAAYLDGYKVKFDSSDGISQTIDFEEFL